VPITSTRSEVAGDIVHAMQVQFDAERTGATGSFASALIPRPMTFTCARWCTSAWKIARTIRPPSSCWSRPSLAIPSSHPPMRLGARIRDEGFYRRPKGKQWEEKALAAVENALSLDSELAEGYVARGLPALVSRQPLPS